MNKKSTTLLSNKKQKSLNVGSSASMLGDFCFVNDSWDNASRYIKPKEKTIEEIKQHLQKVQQIKPEVDNLLYTKSRHEWFWSELIEELYFQTATHNALLKKLSIPKNKTSATSVSEEEIQKAKQYPLTSLLDFKRLNMCCPFHNEKTPSLYFYPKTNSAHCFGACSKSFDSIDIYRLLNNCTFVQAVKALQ